MQIVAVTAVVTFREQLTPAALHKFIYLVLLLADVHSLNHNFRFGLIPVRDENNFQELNLRFP